MVVGNREYPNRISTSAHLKPTTKPCTARAAGSAGFMGFNLTVTTYLHIAFLSDL